MEKELNLKKQLEREKRKLLRELRKIQNDGVLPEEDQGLNDSIAMELENEALDNLRNPESPRQYENIPSNKLEVEEEVTTPKSSKRMMVEDEDALSSEKNAPVESLRRTRKKWKQNGSIEENTNGEIAISNMRSPSRIKGYRTPGKEDNGLVMRRFNTDKQTAHRNRWTQKKNKIKEEEDDLLTIVRERMPIDILVQICVANVIEEQTRLVIH